MADLKYRVDVDTAAAQRALGGLSSTIGNLTAALAGAFTFQGLFQVASQFENLRVTMGVLYKDMNLGAQAFDDIKKFAAQSVFSVEDLTNTVIKLKTAGLDPSVPLLRMFADTASVAADSVGALQAITDLYARTTAGGLGLEDLNRLADRGIPVFDILSEKLGKSRLQLSELGKSAEGARVILDALEQGLTERFGGASAARVGTLSQAFANFKDSIANAFDTIGQSGFNEAIGDILRSTTQWIETNKQLLVSIGEGLAGALTFLKENIKALTVAASVFLTIFAVQKITALAASFILLSKAIIATPIGRIAALAAMAVGAFVAFDDETNKAAADLDEFTKKQEKTSEGFKVLNENAKLGGDGTKSFRDRVANLDESMSKFRATMTAVVDNFKRNNNEMIAGIQLETELIGKSKEYADARRAEADITNRVSGEIARLQQEKAKLTQEEIKQGRGGVIDAQIKALEDVAAADQKRTKAALGNSNLRQMAYQLELFGLKQQIDVNEQLIDIQGQMAKLGLSEIEQKYYDIDAAAKKSARSAIQAEEARIGRKLDPDEQKKYYESAAKGTETLKTAQDELYEKSRDFNIGWKEAMNKYVADGNNGFKQAQSIFSSVVGNMEQALDNFVMTGKFKFGDFARSIIQDLLKIQLRAAATNFLSTLFGSFANGAAFSGGRVTPFANGGVVNGPTLFPMADGMGLMGEAGPEAVMPLKRGKDGKLGVASQGGQGTVNNYYNYNISAVDAKSVAQLFSENKRTLLSTVRSAEKELPFGGR